MPLWNPHIAAGMPLLADNASFPFAPLRLLTRPLGFLWSFTLMPLIQLCILAAGAYALSRELGLSRRSACITSLIACFSETSMVWLEFQFWLGAVCWMPWTTVFLARTLLPGGWPCLGPAALTLGFAFLGGQAQVASYAAAFSIGLAVVMTWHQPPATHRLRIISKTAAIIALCGLLGFFLAATQILTTAELVRQGYRPPNRYESQNYLRVFELLTYPFPDFFGNPGNRDFVGGSFFRSSYLGKHGGFVGTLSLFLAIWGASACRHTRVPRFLTLVASGLLLTLLVLRPPVHQFITDLLPWFGQVHHKRVLFLYSFSVGLLAGYGLEDLLKNTIRSRLTAVSAAIWLAAGLLAMLFAVETLLHFTGLSNGKEQLPLLLQHLAQQQERFRTLFLWPSVIFPLASLIVASLCLLTTLAVGFQDLSSNEFGPISRPLRRFILFCIKALCALPALKKMLTPTAMPVALAAELLFFGCRYNPFVDPALVCPETEAIRWLRDHAASERICGIDPPIPPVSAETIDSLQVALSPQFLELRENLLRARWKGDLLPPDTALAFRLNDVRAKESLLTIRYRLFMETLRTLADVPILATAHFGDLQSPLYHLLGVRYFLLASTPQQLPQGFESVYSGEICILRNSRAFPRAFVVHRALVTARPEALTALLESHDWNWDDIALVEVPPPNWSSHTTPAAPVTLPVISFDSPHEIQMRVPAGTSGLLILTDAFDPGWRAYLDGVQAAAVPVDILFRGIWLPPADSTRDREVRWVYHPRSFLLGAALSCMALAVLAATASFLSVRRS
ncbi:MAG: hypothetical protein HYU36_20895 [Planctomycetes bacterium]|nr:hypothetical protein [Planctomycetota bacterium]